MEEVVLPVPPFWEATEMIMFVNLPKAIKGFLTGRIHRDSLVNIQGMEVSPSLR
jgi:hypothetical protein